MILIIDNYDSFTFNLVQLLAAILHDGSRQLVVRRNDETTPREIETLNPERILLSPGPGRPDKAGVSVDVVKQFGSRIPILGVCLGHQAIGSAFGARIVQAPRLMHGRTSQISHANSSVFLNVRNPFVATRYHSLVIAPESLPDELEVTATTDDGVIMGIQHKLYPVTGLQFHPESILTEEGERLLRNWLEVN
ncbi:MAG: aminodeoxychorismate/anthranilate synthase component II [Bacteroidetes bacterium]|nr:aminodeoxychorismate/anthranilate synthase component II [Bacteroidota bacterium]MCW5897058.1 aminodeoxychorismate/anthranilate synthase component II [Bacteroidota bacterium]